MNSQHSPSHTTLTWLAVLALGLTAFAQTPNCQPAWQPTFGGAPGVDNTVRCMAVFDDGSGPALYLGGQFGIAGGIEASHVAKWSGTAWSSLASGTRNDVFTLAVFDDGSGPALFAGGVFLSASGVPTNRIAKWDGTTWTQLGAGLNGTVMALAVFDDGTGPALYAGGEFTAAGATPVDHIARWDGSNWSALGPGVNAGVRAITVFDDGSGPALHAAGYFTSAGGVAANYIAKWDGSAWSPLGSGLGSYALSLTTYDDGAGPALIAGTGGSIFTPRVERWDGANWSALGGLTDAVWGLTAFDDGSGPALYACGDFGGAMPGHIAKWNGSSWAGLGTGLSNAGNPFANAVNANCLLAFDDGSGSKLHVGGYFAFAGGKGARHVAAWNGTDWAALGRGIDSYIEATVEFDDGSGPALFVGGAFTSAGGTRTDGIAKWDGASWIPLGGVSFVNYPGRVSALAVFDDGQGPAVFAGGRFTSVAGLPANSIARWDGTAWHSLGSGLFDVPGNGASVSSLAVFDDGSGASLYVGGHFAGAGGVPALNIARWDGSSWAPVGSGCDGPVMVVSTQDDGSGPALYVGGYFASAGGIPASGMARWTGAGWSDLGNGTGLYAKAFATYDDATGRALYAAGGFPDASGIPRLGVGKWDGSTWTLLGSGIQHTGYSSAACEALAAFDDGSGPALYFGGSFTTNNSIPAANIAKWDGSNWTGLDVGVSREVLMLEVLQGQEGPSLLVGGVFAASPAGDSFLARFANPDGCGTPGVSICEPGIGGVGACPCGNPPAGVGRGCNNSSNTGGARLEATGIARVTYDTVVLTTAGEKPTATSIVLQGDTFAPNGIVFGQGVICAVGNLKRLYTKTAVAGSITAPEGSDVSVAARSAALGDPITPGTHRYYGVYYRDPNVLGGCATARTYNITQQLDVVWSP